MLPGTRANEVDVYRAFHVENRASLQDVLQCMLLSEGVYKAYEGGPPAVASTLATLQESFHPLLTGLQRVQCSLPHVQHRFIVASSAEALYVAFMGTKVLRDYLADANYVQTALWPGVQAMELAAAHSGFLTRSQRVPVELLYNRARQQGKRLVLCGHSLGGAVAKLCTLRLLQQLDSSEVAQGLVKCMAFAAPALGNAHLAQLVEQQGWSHVFYNLTLPEDIVPRLLAMRYAAQLPAAAADTVLQPHTVPHEVVSDTRNADPEPQDDSLARPSWRSAFASASDSPSKPAWHASLSSSLDKLRALTGTALHGRPAASAPQQPQPELSSGMPAHDPPQADAHDLTPGLQQSQYGGLVRAYMPSWAPGRYLPSFVPFGGQHHLYAPVTAPPQPSAHQAPAASYAEDAETLAALEAQGRSSTQALASAGEASSTGSAEASLPGHPGFKLGSPLRGSRIDREQADAERAAATRRFSLPLTYHRMYTMRDRAASICSAAWPLDSATSGVARPAVRLWQDLGPQMQVSVASAHLPIWAPSPSPAPHSEAANRRWFPTALWASTSTVLTRWLPAAEPEAKPQPGKGWAWAPAGRLAGTLRALTHSHGASQPLRSSAQEQSHSLEHEDDVHNGDSVPEAEGSARHASEAPGAQRWLSWSAASANLASSSAQAQSTSRQWLPSGAGRWLGSSPADDIVTVQISVAGSGLAACTSARLQSLDGGLHEARIISAPAASIPPPVVAAAQGDAQQDPWMSVARLRQRLTDAGRRGWQRLQGTARPSSQPVSVAVVENDELVLEARLKQSDAQAAAWGFRQQEASQSRGSGILKVHLRSDFEVVRSPVHLRRRQAWVLGSSSQAVERVLPLLGAVASKHAFLPGVKVAAADSVSYTCYVPTNQSLSPIAQLAAQQIQKSTSPAAKGSAPTAETRATVPHGDRSLSATAGLSAADRLSAVLERSMSMVAPAHKRQAVQAAQLVSAGLAQSLQGARLAANRTAAAASAQLRWLRHRHTLHAMQQHGEPSMLVLCLSGQSADSTSAALASLVGEANGAEIPVLVVLSPENADEELCRADSAKALRLSDRDRLVILTKQAGADSGFQLQRAIFECLDRNRQKPAFHSKL